MFVSKRDIFALLVRYIAALRQCDMIQILSHPKGISLAPQISNFEYLAYSEVSKYIANPAKDLYRCAWTRAGLAVSCCQPNH